MRSTPSVRCQPNPPSPPRGRRRSRAAIAAGTGRAQQQENVGRGSSAGSCTHGHQVQLWPWGAAVGCSCSRAVPPPCPAACRADQNMAGLSRAKAASIQILRTSELKASECKRPNIVQFHVSPPRPKWPRLASAVPGALAIEAASLLYLTPLAPPRGAGGTLPAKARSRTIRNRVTRSCPSDADAHPDTALISLHTLADAKDQVPAGAPHHQDAEGLQDHLQGVLREDLLRLGGCTALLVSCASSGV